MLNMNETGVRALTVVGIDLANKSWGNNGSATLSFTVGPDASWTECRTDAIAWPGERLTADRMVAVIDRFMREVGGSAVSIDGPQGWRDPLATMRKGVGRLCDLEARTPGKVGVFGTVYPRTYSPWVVFSIDVFRALLRLPHVVLVNEKSRLPLDPLPANHYYLLECFPSSIWRTSGLSSLPGHGKAPPPVVEWYAEQLRQRYYLPATAVTSQHDQLQALVAALPAAGLLGGPCVAVPRGEVGRDVRATANVPVHRVEGLIWDAMPTSGSGAVSGGDQSIEFPHNSEQWRVAATLEASLEDIPVMKGSDSEHLGADEIVARAAGEHGVLDKLLAASKGSERSFPQCQCGCGGVTKGGRFRPGHDAKLKGMLLRRIVQGDDAALEELRQLGWEHFATKALATRGNHRS